VVWRARDEVLGRDVAVKELRPDHGMSGAQVRTSHQRARREGRIAARLQHPNAVVIYDVAEHEGRPYLIMEYVPSQSLGDILATGAVLTPTEVTSIGAQLASALTAAHERGIVHRDIKPGNVLMTADGTVKLTDFGISRAAGDATVTATGEILGTPAYTAPEVAQGHPVAFPADVFSLGATLYAAAEGIPPFGEDANAMATLLRVVRNEIRPPKRSGPLTDTFMWMLNPEPADRPTMKQVWMGLDAQSAKPGIGIAATPPQTKAFAAPSPTLVVPEPVLNSPRTGPASATPPPRPGTEPQRAEAEAAPALSPTPTPTPTPALSPTPTPTPATTPTSGLGAVSATTAMSPAPTSAMIQKPSRQTRKPVPSAATPPDGTPPPASKLPADAEAAPPPDRRSRSRMPLVVGILVIGTTVLIVAIVVAMNSGKHSPPNQPVAHGSTTPAPSSPAKPTATTASRPSTTPSSVPSSSSPPSSSTPTSASATPTDVAGQLSSFLINYYSLLPGNQAQAFNSLTPAYQTNTAQGRSGYAAWWNSIDHVELKDVVAKAPSTVTATIYYYFKNGTRTAERTVFGLTQDGSTFKIASSSVQSSQPF
jgi:eukaryotic-like serine/threonine-protein kinase